MNERFNDAAEALRTKVDLHDAAPDAVVSIPTIGDIKVDRLIDRLRSPENDHANMVAVLVKSPAAVLGTLSPAKTDLIHASMGISGEAGELLDAIKKHVIYDKPLDRENVIEELGDLEFYMEQLRQRLGISRPDTLERNIAKLSVRYAAGYSDAAAAARADKAA